MNIGRKNMNNILKKMGNNIDYQKRVDDIVNELMKFSDKLREVSDPVDFRLIDLFEEKYHVELPADYKYLLSKTNGFILTGYEVIGLGAKYDLDEMYHIEHFEVIMPQYRYLVPFSPDGFGNFYCFNTQVKTYNGMSNQIVFWQSNYEYTETDKPEIVYDSLADYINDWIIGHTLKWYNYDGSEK